MSKNRGINEAAFDLFDAFTEIAVRYPQRPAIVHNGHTVRYHRLHERANALAERLAADLGSIPGAVAVPAARTPETVVALLGILAAGGVYCPVDPAFPLQRRQAMVTAAGCRAIVGGDQEQASRLGLQLMELEPVTEPAEDTSGTPAAAPGDSAATGLTTAPGAPGQRLPGSPRNRVAPDAPAYILFTSGSTGQPKPVVTPRRAISTAVHALSGLFGLTPDDRVLQFASLNWDTSFEEILPALTTGATLVLDSEAHSGSFPRFLRMVERERVTVLDLPTAFWHELVLHLAEDRPALPGCLRLVVIGGEAANPTRLADWSGLDTGLIRLVNTYGCTETTLVTHAVDLHGPQAPSPGAPWAAGARAPIGRALPHVVQRISEQGELLIGGPALALGYLGLPETTEARFTVLDGDRCFRTGDRVSSSPDGVLIHEGRLDHEIKVRGIRVDPAEVEAHIAGHPAVSAVAVAGAAIAGRSTLVAYVVPRRHAQVATLDTDVLSYLRGRVPGHLVPSRITVVPDLVLTASGKVDRTASHQRHATPDQVKGDLR
jgi:nonribosomal peptide synthetase protein VioO